MGNLLDILISFIPFIGMAIAASVALWGAYRVLIGGQTNLDGERRFSRQLIMIGLTFLGLLVCVLVLPIGESSRNQLIGLIGILISGVLAFSSTTIISNLMAGVLLRITKPFRVGDFIRIGDHFGRVSERGLFDTEIQTETRELIALPNTYCINNPVVATLSSGTIISAKLSLGYDIDHKKIENLLIEAAHICGLEEPFVHILELGNFAVTYRVSGLLEESKRLITVRSSLYGCVLDTLHGHGVEIMSPSFMNQRQSHQKVSVIPPTTMDTAPDNQKASAEDIAFDKADKAEEIENEKQQLVEEIENLEETMKDIAEDGQKKFQQDAIEKRKGRLKLLEETPNPVDADNDKSNPVAVSDSDTSTPDLQS